MTTRRNTDRFGKIALLISIAAALAVVLAEMFDAARGFKIGAAVVMAAFAAVGGMMRFNALSR